MELSYAQNLEDYHLALLFPDQAAGTYIDVGGGHPVADNVTYWLYLKGWRGLVVEPQDALATLYPHIRPRDAIESCLVGKADGAGDFHVVERLHGFSTTIASHATAAKQFGAAFQTVTKPIRTLAGLCRLHGLDEVDVLKIDVEGAEADVLAGADWRRHRPRVVLVEAVEPGTMAESWHVWEPMLIDHGYRFAYFDGVNRFYLAEEAVGLAERLPKDKTPWNRVRHLYEYGRAPLETRHPDHELAQALVEGFLAALPTLPPAETAALLARSSRFQQAARTGPAAIGALINGRAEFPGAERSGADAPLEVVLATDRTRAAFGRIAAPYDGGQLLD